MLISQRHGCIISHPWFIVKYRSFGWSHGVLLRQRKRKPYHFWGASVLYQVTHTQLVLREAIPLLQQLAKLSCLWFLGQQTFGVCYPTLSRNLLNFPIDWCPSLSYLSLYALVSLLSRWMPLIPLPGWSTKTSVFLKNLLNSTITIRVSIQVLYQVRDLLSTFRWGTLEANQVVHCCVLFWRYPRFHQASLNNNVP